MNTKHNAIVSTFGDVTFTVTPTMVAIFDAADGAAIDWVTTLAAEGLDTRKAARPYVVIWAGAKYGSPVTEGQRGLMVPQDSAAAKAVDRVLKAVFSAEEKTEEAGAVDPVEAALKAAKAADAALAKARKAYAELTKAQQKKFDAARASVVKAAI